jgi:hypothetical protein
MAEMDDSAPNYGTLTLHGNDVDSAELWAQLVVNFQRGKIHRALIPRANSTEQVHKP